MHPAANDTDITRAHATMWAELERPGQHPFQTWDWILHSMGAPHAQGHWQAERDFPGFGPIVQTGTVVGAAGPGAPVPAGTPLVPGSIDAYMAFWAAGIDTPGLGLDPGGRTGGIGIAVPGGPDEPRYALRSAAIDVDIVGGPVTAHGLALEWWSAMTGRTVEQTLAGRGHRAARRQRCADAAVPRRRARPEMEPRPARRDVRLAVLDGPADVARAVLERRRVRLAPRRRLRSPMRAPGSTCSSSAVRRRRARSGARSKPTCSACPSPSRRWLTSPRSAPRSPQARQPAGGRSRARARPVHGRLCRAR